MDKIMVVLGVLGKFLQLKISFIGWKGNASTTLGKPNAEKKMAEVSIAVLTFGIRVTLRA